VQIARKLAKLILFASLAATSAADHFSATRQSERRHSIYVQLSEQIYPISLEDGRPHPEFKWPSKEKQRQIRSQLQNLVREEIGAVLANTEARTNVLKKAVVALQGENNLGKAWPRGEGGNVPFVQSFELDGITTLVVGYSVAFGGLAIPQSDPYLEFYQKIDGIWTFKAKSSIDAAFDGSSFDISWVVSGVAGQAWFLAWRKTFGDPSCSLSVRLLAFDGMHASRIWSQDKLIHGEVSVSKASIQLSFDKEYHSRFRVEEALKVTPAGLHVASRKTVFQ
jgi:hypothetical protein